MQGSFLRRVLFMGLVLGGVLATLPRTSHAQVLYGSISGTVTDQSSAVVPGAKVTAVNEQTGLSREATTNSSGQYRILDVPQGTYTLAVSSQGFKPLKKTGVQVAIGQVNSQDLQIGLGAVTQEVNVSASAVVLQTEKADVHTTIDSKAISNLPLNIYRNFQTIELLAPGVFSDTTMTRSYPNSISDTPDRSLKINSNGLPQHINTTRVDGATNIFVWLPDHMLIVPPQETIQEVNVQTSNFDVEKGLTAGVATDVVTKSGTNDFHGSLYGYHTDQHMDARNLFNHRPTLPKNLLNNDGATIGGPVKKNKLFFFFNYDRTSQRQSVQNNNLLAPADWRKGDFRSALGAPLFDANGAPISVCTTEGTNTQLRAGMIFDPSTGNQADGTGRCAFSSGGQLNVLPSNRLNQGAQNFWGLVPNPNQNVPFTNSLGFNDVVIKTNAWDRNIYTAKVDWNRNERHTIWAKYMGQTSDDNEPFDYAEAGGSGSGLGHQWAQIATIGHSWTLSPSLVVTGHVGFQRMSELATPPGYGKALGQTVLGIPGTNEPLGNILYTGLPGVSMSSFTTLGSNTSWEPVQRNDWTLTISQNMTWIKGKHEYRFGFDAAHNHLNHFQPEIVCCPRGNLYFTGNNTFLNLPADPANPGGTKVQTYTQDASGALTPFTGFGSNRQNSVAAFDLGVLQRVQKSEQLIKSTGKDWQTALYFGDRWKVTPNFTADLGVRWEYYPLYTRDGAIKMERYDPSTNQLFLGGLGGNSNNLGVTTSKKLFAPRLGLAYRYKDKTVIRAGAGITYDTLPLERPLRGFYPLAIGADNFQPSSTVSSFLPYGTFAQGIPLIQHPDISSGVLTPPANVTLGTMQAGQFKRGYLESWNLFVSRKLPKDFLLDVGYVGNHFVHEFNGANVNSGVLGLGAAGQPLYKYGKTTDAYLFNGALDSHYHSLQTTLNRNMGHGLYMQGSYTFSHAITYADDTGWENGLRFNCPPSPNMPTGCMQFNRGTPSFDHTHQFKMAYVYELPFGKGKKFSSSTPVNAIIGGWSLNGIFSAWTGSPLTIAQSGGNISLNTPYTATDPNFVGGLQQLHQTGPGQLWFNTSAWAPITAPVLGTSGRGLSWLRGPGLVNMDMALSRHFKAKERYDFEVRGEAQNVTNTPHWNNPDATCTAVGNTCGGSFGQITSTYGERIVQIGAKITF